MHVLSVAILIPWLTIGLAALPVACQNPPRAADPPDPCKDPSPETVAQMRALPPNTPLVYFLDELARDCDKIDSLRGD